MDLRKQDTIRSRMAGPIRKLAIGMAGGFGASATLLLCGALLPLHAQSFQRRDTSKAAFEQPFNISRGRAIATQGARCGEGEPCFPCFQCHGDRGTGDIKADFPRLAGQSFGYLYGSLQAFASGARPNDVMREVVRSLDDQAMRDVAAYYATVEPLTHLKAGAAEALAEPKPEALTKGGVLAAVGDLTRGVQACANCHGPDGAGLPPSYPYLAGQYADYLEDQLMAWKKGERGGDPLNIMRRIAERLTDDQIRAVAQYYASIRPSKPVPQRLLQTRARAGAPREGAR